MTANLHLVKFIKEARKRGFDDYEIRAPLIKQGWPLEDIESAFSSLKKAARAHYQFKNKITIYLDNELLKLIERRAKKNLLTLPEQIEDILRRSCLSLKKKASSTLPKSKIDDLLVNIFSRDPRGRKKTRKR